MDHAITQSNKDEEEEERGGERRREEEEGGYCVHRNVKIFLFLFFALSLFLLFRCHSGCNI